MGRQFEAVSLVVDWWLIGGVLVGAHFLSQLFPSRSQPVKCLGHRRASPGAAAPLLAKKIAVLQLDQLYGLARPLIILAYLALLGPSKAPKHLSPRLLWVDRGTTLYT